MLLTRGLLVLYVQYLRASLSRQPCERLLASPRRQLLCEGPVTLIGQLCAIIHFGLINRRDMNYVIPAADVDTAEVTMCGLKRPVVIMQHRCRLGV